MHVSCMSEVRYNFLLGTVSRLILGYSAVWYACGTPLGSPSSLLQVIDRKGA